MQLNFWNNHLLLYGYYPEALDITVNKEVWKYSLKTEDRRMGNIKYYMSKAYRRFYHTACVHLDYIFIFFGAKMDPPVNSFREILDLI